MYLSSLSHTHTLICKHVTLSVSRTIFIFLYFSIFISLSLSLSLSLALSLLLILISFLGYDIMSLGMYKMKKRSICHGDTKYGTLQYMRSIVYNDRYRYVTGYNETVGVTVVEDLDFIDTSFFHGEGYGITYNCGTSGCFEI